MIVPAAIAIALLANLLAGGSLRRLAAVQIRVSYLIPLALGIQVLVFTPWWQGHALLHLWARTLYGLSLGVLVLACALNRGVPGMAILGLGLFLNCTVILANGGHMPASLAALRAAGIAGSQSDFEALRVTNSSLAAPDTPLWFLSDVFALPSSVPLANVFSIGDVLIAAGGAWFIRTNARPRTYAKERVL